MAKWSSEVKKSCGMMLWPDSLLFHHLHKENKILTNKNGEKYLRGKKPNRLQYSTVKCKHGNNILGEKSQGTISKNLSILNLIEWVCKLF